MENRQLEKDMTRFVIKLLEVMLATTVIVVIIRQFKLFLKYLSTDPCSVPALNGFPVVIYFWILKSLYKQSCKKIPIMCLVLQAISGTCQLFESKRIFQFCIGNRPLIFFYKPETVEVVLSSTTLIEKSTEYNLLHPWLGTGLLTSAGNKWRYRRKLLTPTFHFKILEDFLPIFHEQSSVLVFKLQALCREPWVDIVPLITACTLDIICETAMGVHINAQGTKKNDYAQAIHEVGEMFFYRALRPWLYPDLIFKCCPSGRKFQRHLRRVHEFTRKVIKEKKASMTQNTNLNLMDDTLANESPSRRKRRAFLELLLEHHFKDPSFTEEDIREEVDTFMFEGHDTTAMALSWALYFLGLDERVQKEVYDELYDIFQDDVDREITRDDLTQMKYLECVIKESLRLHPSVPFFGREVQENFQILDYTIKKGSVCFIFPWMLHRDADNFDKPEQFVPERFFPENSAGRHPYAYVPFSAGQRNCIGQKFALLEEKAVLANILRRFRVTSLDHRDKVNISANLVIRNVQPLRLRFTPRK